MCCKVMCKKVLPAIFIIIALAVAILVTLAKPNTLAIADTVSRFFGVMIPILAIGGLIKYIAGCGGCRCCCCCKNHQEGSTCGCETKKE